MRREADGQARRSGARLGGPRLAPERTGHANPAIRRRPHLDRDARIGGAAANYQRLAELRAVLALPDVASLGRVTPIERIEHAGPDLYRVTAGRCRLDVRIVDLPRPAQRHRGAAVGGAQAGAAGLLLSQPVQRGWAQAGQGGLRDLSNA